MCMFLDERNRGGGKYTDSRLNLHIILYYYNEYYIQRRKLDNTITCLGPWLVWLYKKKTRGL